MDRYPPSMPPRGHALPLIHATVAVAAFLVLALAACGGSASAPPNGDTSTKPTDTATAPATPEPTPDLVTAFQERLAAEGLNIVASFESTYTGQETWGAHGVYTARGGDFLFEQTSHLASGDSEQRVAYIDRTGYVALGDIWLTTDTFPPHAGLAGELAELDYELTGTEAGEDGEAFVLQAKDGDLMPVLLALNLADGVTEDPSGSLELVITPQGEVTLIRVDAEQIQMGTPLEYRVEFVVEQRGPGVEIAAIEDPWEFWTSEHFPYRIAHPAGWYAEYWEADADFEESDMIMSGTGTNVEVYYTPDVGALMEPPVAADTVTPGEWFAMDEAALADWWGVPVEQNEGLTIGPLEARLYTMHVDEESVGPQFHMFADVFRGPDAFVLRWFSDPGNEEEDAATFVRMLATFGAMEAEQP